MSKEEKERIKKANRELWKIVERLVIQEYSVINKMTMRNSYYHIREKLNRFVGTEVSEEQYSYFDAKYSYYQSDKWPAWEIKHSIKRPVSKDPTTALYNGQMIALAYLDSKEFSFYRCQGFMFIEKSGFIKDLELLSDNGWVVLAGQGNASREVREQIMKTYPEKPILVLHDFDYAGNAMVNIFSDGSRRTKHLDLKFDNVIDIGLREIDVKDLNLPIEPEARKYRDKQQWRVELNALTVLISRMGLKNPLLWYVAKRLDELGLPMTKTEISAKGHMTWHIIDKLKEALDTMIREVVEENIEEYEETEIINIFIPRIDELEGDSDWREKFDEQTKFMLSRIQYVDVEEVKQRVLFGAKVIDAKIPTSRRKPKKIE